MLGIDAWVLKSGELLVPFSERRANGVLVDGLRILSPDSPDFKLYEKAKKAPAGAKEEQAAANIRAAKKG